MIGSLIDGRYRLGAELGRGGMGVVYQAHDKVLKRDVAIKMLSVSGLGMEGRGRLMNEAQAAASLNHLNIVAVYDAGQSQIAAGQPQQFVVMELLQGPSLHERRPETVDETVQIACQLCSTLDHAHKHNIIHRDLKPENVMYAVDGR